MEVIKAPHEALRVQTRPIKKIIPGLLQTVKQMIALTKTFKDPDGVGLASTQVGLDGQFFVAKIPVNTSEGPARSADGSPVETLGRTSRNQENTSEVSKEDKFITVFNPKITWTSKRVKKYLEGCLSIPNYWGEVQRHYAIKVTYMDEAGKSINASLKGVIAWIFQHEMDHLNGIIFPDRVLEQKGKFYKCIGKDKTGTDIFEEVTI